MQSVQDFIPPGRRNRPGILMTPAYITIHNTANPGATARDHAAYLKGDRADALPVSWHFTVDDQEIIQHLPINEVGWHAGDGRTPGGGNMRSIGIEICEFSDQNRQAKAEENAVGLVAWLIKEFGISTINVVQHNHWTGKDCPRILRHRAGGWEGFLAKVRDLAGQGTPVLGPAQATAEQAQAWARAKGASETFVSLVPFYWRLSPDRGGVRPEVAYAQAAKETGFGRFGGQVTPDQHNPCGLRTADGRGHQTFPDWQTGIMAHLDHLALYAGAPGYPRQDTPDPRHFPFLAGAARTVEALGGKWAPNPDYGNSIVADYLVPMVQTPAPAPALDPFTDVPAWARPVAESLYKEGTLKELRGDETFWRILAILHRKGVL